MILAGDLLAHLGDLRFVAHHDSEMVKLEPPFRCDFHDPWGNRIQVVDLHDESLIWMLPYREVQKAGIMFREK